MMFIVPHMITMASWDSVSQYAARLTNSRGFDIFVIQLYGYYDLIHT